MIVDGERFKMDSSDMSRGTRLGVCHRKSVPVTPETFEFITSPISSWNFIAAVTCSFSDYESLIVKVVERTGCGGFFKVTFVYAPLDTKVSRLIMYLYVLFMLHSDSISFHMLTCLLTYEMCWLGQIIGQHVQIRILCDIGFI